MRWEAVSVSIAVAVAVSFPVYGGLRFQKFEKSIEGEPVEVFVAREDEREPHSAWQSLGAGSYPNPGLSLPEMASRVGAAMAVNANFYREDTPGNQEPIGLVLHQGKILAFPNRSYPSVGMLEGALHWDQVELRAQAAGQNICRINAAPSSDDCVALWTRAPKELKNASYFSGPVGGLPLGKSQFKIGPRGTWAVQWRGPNARGAKTGMLSLNIGLHGQQFGDKWQKVTEAVSGSHILTTGKTVPAITHSWPGTRQPRTMVGADKEGRPWVAVFDGRRQTSKGVSLVAGWEFLHQSIGAVWALNLDGGGSSTMIYEGRLVNHPSDTYPRSVAVGFGAKAGVRSK